MSELPMMSTLNTKADTNKQLAQIRSYLNQLKDSTESELNNVTYDMLSGALRKRLDSMSEDIVANNTYTSLVADTLSSQYVRTEVLQANYATIGALSAVSASVGQLRADIVAANYVTTDALEANYISAKVIKADYMEVANWTSSGFIAANRISADTITSIIARAGTVSVGGTLSLASTGAFSFKGSNVEWGTITVGQSSYRVMLSAPRPS